MEVFFTNGWNLVLVQVIIEQLFHTVHRHIFIAEIQQWHLKNSFKNDWEKPQKSCWQKFCLKNKWSKLRSVEHSLNFLCKRNLYALCNIKLKPNINSHSNLQKKLSGRYSYVLWIQLEYGLSKVELYFVNFIRLRFSKV